MFGYRLIKPKIQFFLDYRYYQSVGSCYAIPKIPYSWPQAYDDCQAQGAHLVVLNSQAEHDAVYNLTNTEPHVPGARAYYFFFAGYRADVPVGNATVVFKTIFSKWTPLFLSFFFKIFRSL